MKALIQVKVGMIAVIAGIVGVLLGVGMVEAAMGWRELAGAVGATVTSLMVMWLGVELIKEQQ